MSCRLPNVAVTSATLPLSSSATWNRRSPSNRCSEKWYARPTVARYGRFSGATGARSIPHDPSPRYITPFLSGRPSFSGWVRLKVWSWCSSTTSTLYRSNSGHQFRRFPSPVPNRPITPLPVGARYDGYAGTWFATIRCGRSCRSASAPPSQSVCAPPIGEMWPVSSSTRLR